jgi:hypothetical protein
VKRPIVLLLLLSSLAVIAAGCGGGGGGGSRLSKSSYQTQFKSIRSSLSSAASSIGSLKPTDITSLGSQLEKLAGVLDTAVSKVSKLKAPKDIESTQKKLIDGLKSAASELRSYASKVKGTSLSNAGKLVQELETITSSEPFKKIQAAIQEYKAKGYKIG